MSLNALLDASKTSLLFSLGSITFNPTAWNIVARNGKPGPSTRSHLHLLRPLTDQRREEYHNKTITRLFFGSPRLGCYFLAVCIFSAGIIRDHLYVAEFFSFPRLFPLLYACPGPVIPGHSFVPPQILDRTPRAAPCAYSARPARHPPAGRALRPRADIRRDLDLGSWHHGDIPGRLFRDSDGSPRRVIPLQRASRSHVRRQHDVLRRDGFMVRGCGYSRVLRERRWMVRD